MPWLKLFRFLEGEQGLTPSQMGITEMELVKEMLARYKLLTIISKIMIQFATMVFFILGSVEIFLIMRNSKEIIICYCWAFYYLLAFNIVCKMLSITGILFYISSYYLTKRAQLFNQKIDRIGKGPLLVRKFTLKLEINLIVREHTQMCRSIRECDDFFGQFYALGMSIALPLNLAALNFFLFTYSNQFSQFYLSFIIVSSWVGIFLISFYIAMVHVEVRKSYKKMCKLEWKFDNLPIGTKVKVINYTLLKSFLAFCNF
jgi:hypothetical protein